MFARKRRGLHDVRSSEAQNEDCKKRSQCAFQREVHEKMSVGVTVRQDGVSKGIAEGATGSMPSSAQPSR